MTKTKTKTKTKTTSTEGLTDAQTKALKECPFLHSDVGPTAKGFKVHHLTKRVLLNRGFIKETKNGYNITPNGKKAIQ